MNEQEKFRQLQGIEKTHRAKETKTTKIKMKKEEFEGILQQVQRRQQNNKTTTKQQQQQQQQINSHKSQNVTMSVFFYFSN